jgi:DNA-directed RNA polymerase specialized sigma24 family protein
MSVGSQDALPAPAVEASFERFVAHEGERLRRVLVVHFGLELGPEVAADALAWAWEHWEMVQTMENPVGYLYRVAQSAARRHRRWRRIPPVLPVETNTEHGWSEPGLHVALARLSAPQRVALVLVHGLDWSYADAANAMSIPVSTIRNHLHRGMARLRRELGERR